MRFGIWDLRFGIYAGAIWLLLAMLWCGTGMAETKMKRQTQYTAVYKARQVVPVDQITTSTVQVIVTVHIGAIVYTLDGKTPVITDGVPHLKIGESLIMNRKEALAFKGMPAMDGTWLQCVLLEAQ